MKRILLLGLICSAFLDGCASEDGFEGSEAQIEEPETINMEETVSISGEELTQQEQTVFGAVPYYDEDTDGLLQYADGWLYGYLGGRVFRMDAETGEVSVLFETAGTRSIHFCIDNGCLYFLYIPQVTFVDGARADLYRMNCDGTGLVLLAEAIPVAESAESGIFNGERKIQMSVYEDILYIMRNDEVTCFQLLADGSIKEAALRLGRKNCKKQILYAADR